MFTLIQLLRWFRHFTTLLSLLAVCVSLLIATEWVIRIRNMAMDSLDIEMWKYAKQLKRRSTNPVLGHEHVPSASAHLQSVTIRINERGLRGPAVQPRDKTQRRILLLGASIALGWGVAEESTLGSLLERRFQADGSKVEVLNAGIGNYNTVRYVEMFFDRLRDLDPSDILVQYFPRDAEALEPGGAGVLMRNSQLFVTLWLALDRVLHPPSPHALRNHYEAVYATGSASLRETSRALERLASYARERRIGLYFAMTPDMHHLDAYPFTRIHALMKETSEALGYRYIDLLPGLSGLTRDQIWAMPGDPHPNARGHQIMADLIYPALRH